MTETEVDLVPLIIDFASSATNRFTMSVPEMADELVILSRHGAEWPKTSALRWRRAAIEAICNGHLMLDSDNCVGPVPLEAEELEAEELQLRLFDDD